MNDYLQTALRHARPGNSDAGTVCGATDLAKGRMQENWVRQAVGPVFVAVVTALSFAAPAQAQTPSAQELVKRELAAFYYGGKDMSAHVSMRLINAQGNVRARDMVMLRTNLGETGDQRYLMVFNAPADVRGMSFLIWKYAKAEDDRWIYFPALKAVKRIAADDKKSSFVGSDFTYEDVSGRDLDDETHTFVRADQVGERKVYVVESKPKGNTDYAMRSIWIDQEHSLPLKEDYVDAQGKPLRTFSADRVEQIDGQWTITARSMKNHQTGHKTEVVFKDVKYDVGLGDGVFTERNMKNPVQK